MNIKRKEIKVEINNKTYSMILDFESAIDFQDLYGKSIYVGINKIDREQDLKALGCLMAVCLKDSNGPVGIDFIKKLDLIESAPFFVGKIEELMSNSLPKESNNKNKKK